MISCQTDKYLNSQTMQDIADKMSLLGANSLSDSELLAVILDDRQLAQTLLAQYSGSLSRLSDQDSARLRMVGGMGIKRTLQLQVALEFGRRVAAAKGCQADVITTSEDVVEQFRAMMQSLAHEECWALYLSSSNRVIERQRVSQGGVQGTVVDHRLIIKRALELLATQLILIHNHPSGAAEPSPQDLTLTERIAKAAELFDIRLLDHLIISREGHFSFRGAGLL